MPSGLRSAGLSLREQARSIAQALIEDAPSRAPSLLATPDESFEQFCRRLRPDYRWHKAALAVVGALQRVADGELRKLIVNCPPRIGKTELVGRLFPAYFLARYPQLDVGLASYGAEIAHDVVKDARDLFLDAGGEVDPSMRSKRRFMTVYGGSMWGAGFGGAVRGRGGHLLVADDLEKDEGDLESEARSRVRQRWWPNTWLNRRQIYGDFGSAMVVVQQRLGLDDLTGFLFSRPDAGEWTLLALDVVREAEPFPVPEGVQVIEDWRRPGEVLDEALFPPDVVAALMADEDDWLAQYQQRPRARGGYVLRPEWFARRVPLAMVPPMLRVVAGVDLALTAKTSADYTVLFPLGYAADGLYYLFPPYRAQAEAPAAEDAIVARAVSARCSVVGVESVAFQMSAVQRLRRRPELAGVAVLPIGADKDKVARAKGGLAPLAASGQIVLVDDGTGWVETFLAEAASFPRKRKDQIDAVGVAIETLRQVGVASSGYAVGG